METVEAFLAHAIRIEQEAALRFGQLADAMNTQGNREVGRLFRQLAPGGLSSSWWWKINCVQGAR